jgi:hypothetical protein
VIRLLLRLYPASWRRRYGDEFEALLTERPLGPFDVADVLLGALDAQLHLRGIGATFQNGRGLAMSLRIGGYAAIAGSIGWTVTLAVASAISDAGWAFLTLFALSTALLLVGITGLSAFQARQSPRLVWAAFAVPAAGAVVSLVGLVGMAVNGDARFIGDWSGWAVWAVGILGLVVGSALFGLATIRTNQLSRSGAVALTIGALLMPVLLSGLTGTLGNEQVGIVLGILTLIAFTGGWVLLGVSAIRIDRKAPVLSGGMP